MEKVKFDFDARANALHKHAGLMHLIFRSKSMLKQLATEEAVSSYQDGEDIFVVKPFDSRYYAHIHSDGWYFLYSLPF